MIEHKSTAITLQAYASMHHSNLKEFIGHCLEFKLMDSHDSKIHMSQMDILIKRKEMRENEETLLIP